MTAHRRTALLLLLSSLVGCGAPPTEAPVAPAAEDAPEARPAPEDGRDEAAAAKAKSKEPRQKPPRPEPAPLPAAVPVEGYPVVAVVGFGVRLELNPPFQGAIWPEKTMGNRLILSWWDVTAPEAGRSGRGGLHNTSVMPGDMEPDATPTRSTTGEGDSLFHVIEVGGTVVRFPAGATELGGAVTVKTGPAIEAWKVQVGDGELQEWPDKSMLHSTDPATGAPIAFKMRPAKPFGPWRAAPAAP
jgi:hypothetical protein